MKRKLIMSAAVALTTAVLAFGTGGTTEGGGGYYTTTTQAVPTTTHPAYTTTTGAPTSTVSTTALPTTTSTVPDTSTSTTVVVTTPQTVATTTTTSTTTTSTSTTVPEKKVFVCKFVGTPGVDEHLQTGQNPISVSVNAIPNWSGTIGEFFADAQGRSLVIAFDVGQPEPDVSECTPGGGTTTTSTTAPPTSTTVVVTTPQTVATTTTTTTEPGTTTTTTAPATTTTTTQPEDTTSTSTTTPPTTTSTTVPATSTSVAETSTTTTSSSTTTTTSSTSTTTAETTTTTTLPETFAFGGAETVCQREVPTILITFDAPGFASLAGETGTLTMRDVSGGLVSVAPLVYEPGTTVSVLYPGTSVNPDGSIADVPGWMLTEDGFWIIDPTDQHLRDGINMTYELNPTATAFVTYPPESSTCANPNGPFPPTPTPQPGELPPTA